MSDPRGPQPTPPDRPVEPAVADADVQTHPGWRIGSLRGTPIYLGRTWPILVLVILATFGPSLSRSRPDLGAGAYAVAFAYALLLLVSVLAHEAAHALTAQAFGHRVHRIVADLMGGHTSYQSDSNTPGRSAMVALAGPLANAALALVAWQLLAVTPAGVPRLLMGAMAYSNAFVAVFNLLPGLPLDGGFVLDALVWRITGRRTTGLLVAGWSGRVLAALVALWFIGRPLLSGRAPDFFSIAWGALIGSFLWAGAGGAIRSARARALLDQVRLGDLLHPTALVPAGSSVADAVRLYGVHGAQVVAVQDAQGVPTAVVDPRAVQSVPVDQQAVTPVLAVAHQQPAGWVIDLAPDVPVTDAVERMAQLEVGVILVRLPGGGHGLLDAGEVEDAASRRA